MKANTLVITGMGAITPVGIGVDAYWNALIAGKCGVGHITRFDASNLPVQIAAELKGFEPTDFIPKALARTMSPFMQFAYAAAEEALADSGLKIEQEPDRVGIVMGTAMDGVTTVADTQAAYDAGHKVGPRFVPMTIGNIAAAQIAIAHSIRGPSLTLNTACSAGGDAIMTAAMLLRSGEAEAVLAVGGESILCSIVVAGLSQAKALSRRNDDPEQACRPFDMDRDGFVIGEGGGALVIETLEHALARGAKIHAVLAGYANTSDAHHVTAPCPDGAGAAACMKRALARAGMQPSEIGYINAHGTSTKLGDKAETLAIKAVFGGRESAPPISATKSATGHLMGAGGLTEAIACIKAIQDGILPPTLHLDTPDPDCDLDYVPNVARKVQINAAMSNSLGFGGQNSSIILSRYDMRGESRGFRPGNEETPMHEYTYDVTMFRDTFETRFTYLNGFLRNVSRFGDRPALFDPRTGRRWNYRQLNAEANRLAHALRADGVGKNDVVMFALLNSPEFVFCYLAAHKVGAIACPVNYRQGAGEIALVIDDSRPKAFFYDAEFADLSGQALQMCSSKPRVAVVVNGKVTIPTPEGQHSYEEYVAGQPENDPPIDFDPHIYDETTRLYTSGTTGCPKGVPVNNINEVLSAHDVMMHFPLGPTDRTMNMTPWFHRGGIHAGGPCPTLYAGGEVVILRDFAPRCCLEYAEQYKISFLIGVPTIIAMLARMQERIHADLSALKGIVTMGAPFEKTACEKYMKLLTPNIFNGYGTTESFWNTFLRPFDLPEMAGSAGRSCTDDDVRVVAVHEDGSRTEPDEVVPRDNKTRGEIILSSPAKSAFCYYNNEPMTRAKFYKGWLYTGDMGTWDENEFITVSGRKDDMIVSAGENIYPAQIEEVLNAHPKVAESAVVGIPDRLRGEVVAAYVIPTDDSLTVDELKKYCQQQPTLSSYKWPRVYHLVKELPHTATGKLMRYKLREEGK